MAEVFISYSSKNRDLVKILAADIEELGHRVWFDKELTGGHAWWDSILAAIRKGDIFIFALSPESLDSEPCSREYKYAHALNKTILPVLITGQVSANLLPRELSLIQYVDYRQADKEASLELARAFIDLPAPKAMPNPLPQAPDVPVAPILALAELVGRKKSLSFDQQTKLLFNLREEMKNPATRNDAVELLRRFRLRHDVIAAVAGQIDELLPNVKKQGEVKPEPPEPPSQGEVKPKLPKPPSQGEVKPELPKRVVTLPPLKDEPVVRPKPPSYTGSVWTPNWKIVIGSVLLWIVWAAIINNFSSSFYSIIGYNGYYIALYQIGVPWGLHGLLIAFVLHGQENRTLGWYIRAILCGGYFAIFQANYKKQYPDASEYMIWFVFVPVLAVVSFIFVNNSIHYFTNDFSDYALLSTIIVILWASVMSASISYIFSIFYNLSRKRVSA